jgi:ABC-type transporter Mla MlaB component
LEAGTAGDSYSKNDNAPNEVPFKHLIIDLSGMNFIDMAGVKVLQSVAQDYKSVGVEVLFAGAMGKKSELEK